MSGVNPGHSNEDLAQADIEAALAAGGVSPTSASAASPHESAALDPARASGAGDISVDSTIDGSGTHGDPTARVDSRSAGSPAATTGAMEGSMPLDLPEFGSPHDDTAAGQGVEMLSDVDLSVKVELGRAEMAIEDVLRLGRGAIVELDKLAGDPVDVLVNDRLVARGEVLILNDNFCVRISEIVAGLEAEAIG